MEPIPEQGGVIFPQDVKKMTGMSKRSTWRRLRKVRKAFGKPAGSLVKVEEFVPVRGWTRRLSRGFKVVKRQCVGTRKKLWRQ